MAILNYRYEPALVPEKVRKLLDTLFETADQVENKATWLDCFSDDAKIWRNGKPSNGCKGKSARYVPIPQTHPFSARQTQFLERFQNIF
jgi:hypothetical protein